MARYYHEKRANPEDSVIDSMLKKARTKSQILLAPEFWQGQRNFEDDSEVHARHLKPFCDIISMGKFSKALVTSYSSTLTDSRPAEPSPKNMVLFVRNQQ